MGKIIFNNVSSEDLGLVVQTPPSYEFPGKDVESTHVIGRNGDVVIDNGSYKNVTRTYNVAVVFRKGTNFVQNANRIVEWLYSSKGYARLEDTYEPEYFRKAVYNSGGDNLSNYYDEATVIKISFVCKPQRWLKIGEEETKIQNGQSAVLSNPTKYTALPKIEVKTYKMNLLSQEIVNQIIPKNKKIMPPAPFGLAIPQSLVINYQYLIDAGYSKIKIKFRHLETNFDTYVILDINKLKNDLKSGNNIWLRIYDDIYNSPSNLLFAYSLEDGEIVIIDYVWSEKQASSTNVQEGVKLLACYKKDNDYPIGYSSSGTNDSGEIPIEEKYSYIKNTLKSIYDGNDNCYIKITGIEDLSIDNTSTIEFQQERDGKMVTYNTVTIKNDMEYLSIDSEISECYNDKGYQNSKVSATDGFPYLLPGETNIKVTNCDITITPRWWTL